jgi:hypothetical protein
MCSLNSILVTIHNPEEEKYNPPMELQRTLRSSGVLAEIVSPYSDLSKIFHWKIKMWKLFTRLSTFRFFSFLIPVIFFLKGLENYRQIKIHWTGFDRILVYDQISGFAAKKAINDQIPVVLLSHYSEDPYMAYMYKYGVEKRRLGYIFMQKALMSMFNQPIYKLLSSS